MLFSLRITVFVFPGAAINIASRTGYEPAPRCFFPLCAELENKRVGGLRHISTTLCARQAGRRSRLLGLLLLHVFICGVLSSIRKPVYNVLYVLSLSPGESLAS